MKLIIEFVAYNLIPGAFGYVFLRTAFITSSVLLYKKIITDKFFIIYTLSAIDFFVLLRCTIIENFCSKKQNCLIGEIWRLKEIVI